ncbi:MAG: hypothetical protein V3T81_03955, partial [Thermoanaerobaculia bacterium]
GLLQLAALDPGLEPRAQPGRLEGHESRQVLGFVGIRFEIEKVVGVTGAAEGSTPDAPSI